MCGNGELFGAAVLTKNALKILENHLFTPKPRRAENARKPKAKWRLGPNKTNYVTKS